jgi:hypothetical protein
MTSRCTTRSSPNRSKVTFGLAIVVALVTNPGCQQQQPPIAASANPTPAPPKKATSIRLEPADSQPAFKPSAPTPPPATGGLADLAAAARDTEFDLPQFDESAILASGLRKLAGQHITIYTDLPPGEEIDELPRLFDAAVPLWCDYFSIPREKLADWKLIGSVMKEKSRFTAVGLYQASLPDFTTGYTVGSQLWLYDQPSAYYRRHLLLHEGTHAFMLRWLHGAGPPWYMEGMAELLSTHHWKDGELKLAIMPANRDEVPYWGRIKIIKDDVAADKGLSLIDVMKYDAQAHLQLEPYGWCWGAAWFLDKHPLTHNAFADLQQSTRDRTLEFSKRFYERVKNDWPAITEDWQLFTHECDYGYDVPRAVVMRKAATELPAAGATVTLATDRGWQSTGFRLIAGKKYDLKATGRYTIVANPKTWPCEAGGITIHYHRGQPLGMLLAGISETDPPATGPSPLTTPTAIGLSHNLTPTVTGTLFLKINEASSALADNTGTLRVAVRESP